MPPIPWPKWLQWHRMAIPRLRPLLSHMGFYSWPVVLSTTCKRNPWLAAQVMAHNLARWTVRIGLGEQTPTTKTLRRRFFSLAGRLTRSARRPTLHLPQRWPWETQFSRALARLRAIPLPA